VTDPSTTTTNISWAVPATTQFYSDYDRRAAEAALTAPQAPCPDWCIGLEHPVHDAWSAEDYGDDGWRYTRDHVAVPTTVPISSLLNPADWPRVQIIQMEIREPDGLLWSEPPCVMVLGEAAIGANMTVEETRHLGSILVATAAQLERILAGGAR
jgi:hypothetical protein